MNLKIFFVFVALVSGTMLFAKMPVIGVSGYTDEGKNLVKVSYSTAVRNAGGVPLLIPVTNDDAQIEAVLNVIDGLVMTGGANLDPYLYGEDPLLEMYPVDAAREEFDLKLVRAAVAKGIPVFGICRGVQLITVAFGGSLWQDIPSQTKSKLRHRAIGQARDIPVHSIRIAKGSFLEKALGAESTRVNTFHHQAVKKPAKGFKVVATAPDGIIEAVERVGALDSKYQDGGALIIGTQFHPEDFCAKPDAPFVPIFKLLIEAATEN